MVRGSPGSRLAAAAAIVASLALLSLWGAGSGALEGFRLRAADRFHPAGPTDGRILVVELDAETYGEFGAPLPRSVLADLVRAIDAEDPAVIALDVILDGTAADDARRPAAIRAAAASEDQQLIDAILASGKVILAAAGDVVATRAEGAFELRRPTPPLAAFAAAARGVGIASVAGDRDQIVRGMPTYVLLGSNGIPLPSLSLAAVGLADARDAGRPDDPVPRLREDGVQVGDRAVATGPGGILGLNFTAELSDRAPDRPGVSALDVLDGSASIDLRDRIVLVGATDPLSGDRLRTPASTVRPMAGVYVQANAINTVLTGFAREVPAGAAATAATVAAVALVVALGGAFLRLRWLPVVVVGVIVGVIAAADLAWQRGEETDVIYPGLAAVVAGLAVLAFRYVTEERDRRRVLATFGEYVPPGAVEQLLDRGRFEAATQGERVEVTVLFADLRGFTATSADLDPRDVRSMLEHFYERAAGIVFEHGGTVMQYVGDEVFSVFGAPAPLDDHAGAAFAAAVALRDAAGPINRELAARGLPGIAYGIGCNSGPVVAGHVGNRYRRQYAVVGDTVNVGARLCSAAGAGEVVVSGSVCERTAVPDDAALLEGQNLKGVSRDLKARVLK